MGIANVIDHENVGSKETFPSVNILVATADVSGQARRACMRGNLRKAVTEVLNKELY